MATSCEKSEFLHRERDVWVALQENKAARDAAKGELAKECKVATNLWRRCSELETEARDS